MDAPLALARVRGHSAHQFPRPSRGSVPKTLSLRISGTRFSSRSDGQGYARHESEQWEGVLYTQWVTHDVPNTCRAGRSRGRGCFNPGPERRRLRRGNTGSSILFGWALSCWSSQEVVRVSRSCSVGIRRNIGASCKNWTRASVSFAASWPLAAWRSEARTHWRVHGRCSKSSSGGVGSQSWQFQRLPAQLSPTAPRFCVWCTVALYLVTFQCARAPAFTNYPLAVPKNLQKRVASQCDGQ